MSSGQWDFNIMYQVYKYRAEKKVLVSTVMAIWDYIHRSWRDRLAFLGKFLFIVLENDSPCLLEASVVGWLSCSPSRPEGSWVRFRASSNLPLSLWTEFSISPVLMGHLIQKNHSMFYYYLIFYRFLQKFRSSVIAYTQCITVSGSIQYCSMAIYWVQQILDKTYLCMHWQLDVTLTAGKFCAAYTC